MRRFAWGSAAAAGAFFAMAAARADQPAAWAMGFQTAVSPVMQRLTSLAIFINGVIVAVVVLVTVLVAWVAWRYNAGRNPVPATWAHNTPLEIAWTAVPAIILLVIAVPSFRLLYYMDRAQAAQMTLKVTGHQWYWSYEYPDQGNVKFDANIVQDGDLKPGQPRLLATDNAVVLPVGVPVRILVTADDVIHSWSVPAFGIKTDAIPGRVNETWVRIDQPGTYYGQCSQLCGLNHGFMPIMVRAVPKAQFHAWLDVARKLAYRDASGLGMTAKRAE
ncbi:MAG: cytochrome c oxidase subunit II [Magnetospirillum sp.]|nr:cytochrome c oxidase subunit II [Magnetospirillum sp.]